MKTLSLAALLVLATSAAAQQVTRIPATDRSLAGTPRQQFSIGAEDGEDWELLSRVAGVAFDAQDNLYVLDGGNSRVLVFNAAGKFVRKIGKKGGGPGELMSPVGLALTKDGFIAITDLGRPGVSLFKTNGTFVKNLIMGDTLGMPAFGAQPHPSGGVVVRANPIFTRAMRVEGASQLGGPTGPRLSPITWLPTRGDPKKLYTITLPSITPKVTESGGQGARQVMVRMSPPAFAPPLLWSVLPNGAVAVADEANYRIKIAAGGKVERIIERAFPLRQATERDKDQARAQRRRNMKTGTGMTMTTREAGRNGTRSSISAGGGAGAARMSDAEIEQQIREMTFLETIPALRAMTIDPKGRLWIERTGKNVTSNGPIDIIDAAGKYVGTLQGKLPDAISRTGRAAYIERDDMDVEKVIVSILPASWR